MLEFIYHFILLNKKIGLINQLWKISEEPIVEDIRKPVVEDIRKPVVEDIREPDVEDIRKPDISIKDYFTKWRLESIERNFNNKEAKKEAVIMKKIKISNNSNKPEVKAKRWLLTIPCILPGCNKRHYNNEEAKENHMKKNTVSI